MNKKSSKRSIFNLVLMAIAPIIIIVGIYSVLTPKKKLPVFNPSDVNSELVDADLQSKRKNHKIADFKLINQNGDTITEENYKDKIYVADFFFTRCKTICGSMTSNMEILQNAFIDDDEIMLLSHSVTPIIDSVSVLKNYSNINGVIDKKWNITTGNKKHIYDLARKSYFAVLNEGDGGLQDFIHTEKFILVDKKKQIRGFYDGTDIKDINLLIKDIRLLKTEKIE